MCSVTGIIGIGPVVRTCLIFGWNGVTVLLWASLFLGKTFMILLLLSLVWMAVKVVLTSLGPLSWLVTGTVCVVWNIYPTNGRLKTP